MYYFENIPCGETLPINNVHAVSVSMPRLRDVIGYEENDPTIKQKIKSGYPRFITHPFIVKIQKHLKQKFGISKEKEVILISSQNSALSGLFEYTGKNYDIISDRDITAVCVPRDSTELGKIRLFLQHTGYIPSSRLAENYLINEGLLSEPFKELLYTGENPQGHIKNILADAYEIKNRNNVMLGICGMNAIFAAFRTLEKIQNPKGKNVFIQFGWLYLDTMEILKKFSSEYIIIKSVADLNELEKTVKKSGDQIAGIFTEVTTNPLIQTPDLPGIHRIAGQYDIPVIIDATFGTPYNVKVTSYSDIIIESLTKFACGNADLLMGALIVNESSSFYTEIKQNIQKFIEPPFERDIRRLAFEITGYETRIKKINKNTLELVQYFKKCKKVKEIYWPYQDLTVDNYKTIQKHPHAIGGVISVIFTEPLKNIYDRIKLPKGPSLGTEFTLLMPYVYLAHYDLTSTKKGRKSMSSFGIHPDLLRITVGIEKSKKIIESFDKVLR